MSSTPKIQNQMSDRPLQKGYVTRKTTFLRLASADHPDHIHTNKLRLAMAIL